MSICRKVPYRLLFFLLLLSPASSQTRPSPLSTPCPVILPTTRIVGGTLIEAPYMVSLNNLFGSCSGTLITRAHVLTAAHCRITPKSKALISSTGGTDGKEIPILSTVTHPTEDIAVVTLSFPADVEPVRILTNPDLPTPWSFVRAQGYGRQSYHPFPSDDRLRFVDMPVISPELCRELRQRAGRSLDPDFDERYICTGYPESASCSPCNGDSGGPILSFLKNNPVLLGVISRGAGCGLPDNPGLAVRISRNTGWLDILKIKYIGVSKLGETFLDQNQGNNFDPSKVNATRGPIVNVVTVETGLSSGAIAGIVVAGIVAGLVAVLAVVLGIRWKRKRADEASGDDTNNVGDGDETRMDLTDGTASLLPVSVAVLAETDTGGQSTQVDQSPTAAFVSTSREDTTPAK